MGTATEYATDCGTEKASKGRIEARDVGIRFETRKGSMEAVRSVSMHVAPGEFVSLIGPSGCGKSTLLNAVAGFIEPSAGRLTVDGQGIKGPGPERGVVFQQYSLFPWMTVRKNVEFGLKMHGMPRLERERQARTLLGLAGLLSFENHYPDQLSGGMKQRVGIVRALATSPQVLLMDEPFGALDAQTRVVMQEILTNMWQRLRISVLFITHDIDEAIFLSDRIYVMTARPGRIKAELPVNLPRPRTPAMMASPEFVTLVQTVRALIREESLASMKGELKEGGLSGLSTDLGPQGAAHVV
jgi:NitT/TauT family transport system ATP-binding protein